MQGAQSRLVDRYRVAAECMLDHRGRDVVRFEGVIGAQHLEGFLERLLGEHVERETIGPIEELPEESADALGPGLGFGNAGQGLLNLVDAADPDLIPVEELVVEPRECLVGVLASRVFVTDSIDDGIQHRELGSVAIDLGLVSPLQQRVNVVQ